MREGIMFTSKKNMKAREVESIHDALLRTLASQDTWFDGTQKSIDARRRDLTRATSLVRSAMASGESLGKEALFLDRELAKTSAMETRILADAAFPRKDIDRHRDVSGLSVAGRRFVAMHADSFLADNFHEDDLEEVAQRAEDYADVGTIQLPATEAKKATDAFVAEVLRRKREQLSSKKVATALKSVDIDSVPDDILFR